ncbi:hypothetical protein TRFO_04077 [Tritrichomonas foetus]|uniref:Uncharacterized protein n=1 Tax=Tritrichomonas foetus TaxID=1144522 RepID=A0A1J4KNX0_9EUKA|nr:hypothetical protein TRFO_04077 [Tritrichomonas foetus]|eukprot:OHT11117.1 hypothetical protein TRFO_04077 [Tritrichomonas foetus]
MSTSKTRDSSQKQIHFELPPDDSIPPQISSPDPIRTKTDSKPSPMKFDFDKESCTSVDTSSFVLDVDPTNLESLWLELGLLPSEIEKEKNKLNRLISEVRYNAKKAATNEKLKLIDDINKIKERHISLIRAIGGSEEECELVEDSGYEGTLRQRLAEVQAHFQMFEPRCQEVISQFEKLKEKTDELFDKIGYSIDDRGEFAEIGENDLSEERKKRFIEKAKELEDEIQVRGIDFAKMKEKVEGIANKIGVKLSPRIASLFELNDISTTSFEAVQEYLEDLSLIRNSRIAQISELALEISHEWELLGISDAERKAFIESHAQLTEKCVQECSDEVVRLRNLRNEKLPELIERAKSEILTICQTLHFPQNETDKILSDVKIDECNNMATFNAYEAVVIDLRRLLVISQPIIDLIRQKDEIVKEYEEISSKEEQGKENQINKDEKSIDPKTDKVKRRYKFVLPRLEKKILLATIEFKQTNGTDFMWNGSKLSDSYEHIILSNTELSQLRTETRRKSIGSRKSLGTSVTSKTSKNNINFLFE